MIRKLNAASLGLDPDDLEELLKGEDALDQEHIGAPLAFITEVCLLTEGRAALIVAFCIFRRTCICDSWTVTLPSTELGPLGVDRRRKQEALIKLRDAGLIKVRNAKGQTAKITLLWRPN